MDLCLQSLELLWDELSQKMAADALEPLNGYCAQFADLKAKIAKRSRKLVDYDSIRHSYESTKLSAKKPDDPKLMKAKEELTETKKLYDDINQELGEKLPSLYDGRYSFCVNHLQTLLGIEGNFHTESAKVIYVRTDDHTENSVAVAAAPAVTATSQAVVAAADKTATVNKTAALPNVLFKVRATHRYSAEDTDELSFEAGEIILVVPYDDPEDQDEGWLMGIKEGTEEKGVFPVNFTKPV
ncbi:unnamed protein product [Soboliphyme baturini]|uniref:SH3 domain-containing protein n=1 Tax=Soboliphyme baturini TaxID=241478 RepID=A0A183IEB3_9BILA|nr:unnamed protein product [Soboliphyme baturini]